MPFTPEQEKLRQELLTMANEQVAACKAAEPVDGYVLTTAHGMVTIADEGNVFRLAPCKPGVGFRFDDFLKAKRAASRWNDALNADQRKAGCQVHAISHAQYIENTLLAAEQMVAMLTKAGS